MAAPDPSPAPDPAPRRPAPRGSGLRAALAGWRVLTTAQQRTAAAAVVLLVSLQAPWYSTETVTRGAQGALQRSQGTLSGFAGFSFVEAAVLLVALAVLVLTWARATERRFSLPFDDGTLVTAGAAWAGALVVYRLFDRPSGDSGPELSTLVGLSWGIFATLLAVGLLGMTGLDQRRAALARRGQGPAPPDPADERPVVDPHDVVRPPAAPAAPASRSWSYDEPGSELERRDPGTSPTIDEPARQPAPRGPVAPPAPSPNAPAPDGRPREAPRPEHPPRD